MMGRAALGLLLLMLAAGLGAQERAPVDDSATLPTRAPPILPHIRALDPDNCLSPGARAQLRGEDFGERARWPLVLVSGGMQLPLNVLDWGDRQINLRLPARARLEVADYWQLGFYKDGRWHGQPLSRLTLCAEPAPSRVTASSAVPSPSAPPAPAPREASAAPVPENSPPVPVETAPAQDEREAAATGSDADKKTPVVTEPEITEPEIAEPEITEPEATPAVDTEPPQHAVNPEPAEPVETAPDIEPAPSSPAAVVPAPAGPDTRLLDMPLPAAAPAAPMVSDSDYEPGQLVITTATMAEAQAIASALAPAGMRVKSRKSLPALEMVVTVLRLPADAEVSSMVAQVAAQFPQAVVDANHRYRLQDGGARTWGLRQINWQTPSAPCISSVRLGVMDTLAEASHPALADVAIVNRAFTGRDQAAETDHGTALAVLLAGRADAGFASLLPGARVRVAGVFRQRDQEPDTTTEYLLDGLNWLLDEEVQVINLSLGGARNRVLERALVHTLEQGVGLVAAAGNSGPGATPVYPAAQPGVVAVTAVDASGRRYRHANTGAYIDVAAPGVDLWLANSRGEGSFRSGSSYATAFVTALVALHGPAIDFTQHTRDLGDTGRDDVYGWGLLRWSDCP